MRTGQTFYDWEDELRPFENIYVNIYVNETLCTKDLLLEKLYIYRDSTSLINLSFLGKESFYSNVINHPDFFKNPTIKITLCSPYAYTKYKSLILHDMEWTCESIITVSDSVETKCTARKIAFLTTQQASIVKEWYGCCNALDFNNFDHFSKNVEEITTYKANKRTLYVIKDKHFNSYRKCIWIKYNKHRFKVDITKPNDSYEAPKFVKYTIEYNNKWGGIPTEEERKDISLFLSFVIGTKMIKFGETHLDSRHITHKEYISLNPLDTALLYMPSFQFYNTDYRRNDTDAVIKEVPKMLRRYFMLKDQYRLDEVLSILLTKSYLSFNFISYVTYIEMFANIEIGKNPTIVSKEKFRDILNKLKGVKKIPKEIESKLPDLNKMGIGKKVKKLLSKNKIDYGRYKDVFSARGKVVHGEKVDIKEMYLASEKAKELLTILTLKKLNYTGCIRNFTNNEMLISLKDMTEVRLED